jgi:hypothetical protein
MRHCIVNLHLYFSACYLGAAFAQAVSRAKRDIERLSVSALP